MHCNVDARPDTQYRMEDVETYDKVDQRLTSFLQSDSRGYGFRNPNEEREVILRGMFEET